MKTKRFPTLALVDIFYPELDFDYKNEQDIVQFMTLGFQSINNLDDDITKESVQNRLKKQFPEIKFDVKKELLLKNLKEKYGEEVTIKDS